MPEALSCPEMESVIPSLNQERVHGGWRRIEREKENFYRILRKCSGNPAEQNTRDLYGDGSQFYVSRVVVVVMPASNSQLCMATTAFHGYNTYWTAEKSSDNRLFSGADF